MLCQQSVMNSDNLFADSYEHLHPDSLFDYGNKVEKVKELAPE